MDLMEFMKNVSASEYLEGCGLEEETVIIRHIPSGLLTRIPCSDIEKVDWTTLEEILIGKREPQVLQHMCRVVGYFSRIENWNRSKLGEHSDRTKGNYKL